VGYGRLIRALGLEKGGVCSLPGDTSGNGHRSATKGIQDAQSLLSESVISDIRRLGQFIGELTRSVFADPKPNEVAR
jgi:hypothetical protein